MLRVFNDHFRRGNMFARMSLIALGLTTSVAFADHYDHYEHRFNGGDHSEIDRAECKTFFDDIRSARAALNEFDTKTGPLAQEIENIVGEIAYRDAQPGVLQA